MRDNERTDYLDTKKYLLISELPNAKKMYYKVGKISMKMETHREG